MGEAINPLKAWLERDGGLLRLRLARPKANIVDAAMIGALPRGIDKAPRLRWHMGQRRQGGAFNFYLFEGGGNAVAQGAEPAFGGLLLVVGGEFCGHASSL